MIRDLNPRAPRTVSRSRPRQKERLRRLLFEPLEDRTMLDTGGLPAAIVVGRILDTPSTAATSSPIAVVFRRRGPEQPGDDHLHGLQRAGRPGDRRLADDDARTGRDVHQLVVTLDGTTTTQPRIRAVRTWPGAWGRSRGTTARASPHGSLATPIPLQLDAGASAYATLDAGAVSASTPAATLRAGNVPTDSADSLLAASTPDPLAAGTTPTIRSSRKRRRSSTTTRHRSSTSCTPRSATTPTSARCAARGGRSGAAPAMRSTSPAWAWP